jgi:Pregnancy-associated plasma protein-A
MPESNDSPPNAPEAHKLKAETEKYEAERRKIDLEAEEIRQRLTRKWYLTRYLLEAVIGGLVAAGLVAAWATQFLQPMLQSKEELRLAQTQKQAVQVEVETLRNEKERLKLEKDRADIQQKYDSLVAAKTKEAENYQALARSIDAKEGERKRSIELAQRSVAELDLLKKKVSELTTGDSKEKTPERDDATALQKIREMYDQIVRRGRVTIPVVVHVVYGTDAENISDDQIKSQLDVLNKDYRAKNADLSRVPAPFKERIGDAHIEFVLATEDPKGNPTAGITRTKTRRGAFRTDDAVKSSATGGIDPWDTKRFLNIWVCSLADGLLNYAQFPDEREKTDGVVVNTQAFGTTGTAKDPFNRGRSTTHVVGHYLGLRHIWGDTPDCMGSDLVADTPNQKGPNFGKPTFPHVTCNNGPNGDMFMNFMDYVDDDAMYMFTRGQVVKMHETLAKSRGSLARK